MSKKKEKTGKVETEQLIFEVKKGSNYVFISFDSTNEPRANIGHKATGKTFEILGAIEFAKSSIIENSLKKKSQTKGE